MPKPSHVEAFEFFTEGQGDEIRDYIAFGLFMRAEGEWASQSDIRTDDEYRRYHENLLTSTQRNQFRASAGAVLNAFAATAIGAEGLSQHRKFRAWGIVEAVGGAFVWTAILIAISVMVERAGIDILEIYRRAAGIH